MVMTMIYLTIEKLLAILNYYDYCDYCDDDDDDDDDDDNDKEVNVLTFLGPSKNYERVHHHCHHRCKSRGAAHSIWNLQ